MPARPLIALLGLLLPLLGACGDGRQERLAAFGTFCARDHGLERGSEAWRRCVMAFDVAREGAGVAPQGPR